MNLTRTKSPHGTRRALTLIELLIVLCVLAVVAGGLLLYREKWENRHHGQAARVYCVNNLKQVGLAFRMYALDNSDNFPIHYLRTNGQNVEKLSVPYAGTIFPYFTVMSNELSTPKILYCPEDKNRVRSVYFTNLADSNISYFLNLDAVELQPSAYLGGDRNLSNLPSANARMLNITSGTTLGWTKALHSEKGNLLFGDASVQTYVNGRLPRIVEETTNRLVFP